MRALEALKTTRNVDAGRVDPGAELAALREQVRVLRDALGEAVEHLDWVGYGDSYERECARDTGLIDRLDNALDPEKLAKLVAARIKGFGLLSARKLVSGLGTLDNIINAEPADLDAIFGKGSIKSLHLRKYLSDPANVDHLRLGAQAKPKDGK